MSRKYTSSRTSGSTQAKKSSSQLPAVQPPVAHPQGQETKVYDKDGYHYIEKITPNSHVIIKYNDTSITYTYSSGFQYTCPYSRELLNAFANTSSYELGSIEKLFDDIDDMMDEIDHGLFGDSSTIYSDDPFYHKHRPTSRVIRKEERSSSSSTGCCGCLLWALVFLAVLCLVMYGMSEIGESIIDFFKNLF